MACRQIKTEDTIEKNGQHIGSPSHLPIPFSRICQITDSCWEHNKRNYKEDEEIKTYNVESFENRFWNFLPHEDCIRNVSYVRIPTKWNRDYFDNSLRYIVNPSHLEKIHKFDKNGDDNDMLLVEFDNDSLVSEVDKTLLNASKRTRIGGFIVCFEGLVGQTNHDSRDKTMMGIMKKIPSNLRVSSRSLSTVEYTDKNDGTQRSVRNILVLQKIDDDADIPKFLPLKKALSDFDDLNPETDSETKDETNTSIYSTFKKKTTSNTYQRAKPYELINQKLRCPKCGAFVSEKTGVCNNYRCNQLSQDDISRILNRGWTTNDDGEIIFRDANGDISASTKNQQKLKKIIELKRVLQTFFDNKDESSRSEMESVYDDFVKEFGYLSSPQNRRLLDKDIFEYRLLSLERNYDIEMDTAEKSSVFSLDYNTLNQFDFESLSLQQKFYYLSLVNGDDVPLDVLCERTKTDKDSMLKELLEQKVIFNTPYGYTSARKLLSGNVRGKINLIGDDQQFKPALDALKDVLPVSVSMEDIAFDLSSTWLWEYGPRNDIERIVERLSGERWLSLRYNPFSKNISVQNSSQQWIADAINGVNTVIYKSGGKEIDIDATNAVREKQSELRRQFVDEIRSSDTLTEKIEMVYNYKFNSFVSPDFDNDDLDFFVSPISKTAPEMYSYQKRAIKKVRQQNTLIAHAVGTGKSRSLISGIMEYKTLNPDSKPMQVIPNATFNQFIGQFYELYPTSKLLVISDDDMSSANINQTLHLIKEGDWDSVLISASNYDAMPVSNSTELKILIDKVNNIPDNPYYESAKKRLDKKIEKLEIDIKNSGNSISWDDLGITRVQLDEADAWKNFVDDTGRGSIGSVRPSTRAYSNWLKMKSVMLDNRTKRKQTKNPLIEYVDDGGVMATGTPAPNSIEEIYGISRILGETELTNRGISTTRDWLTAFTKRETEIRPDITGNGFESRDVITHAINVPEIMQSLAFADIEMTPAELMDKLPSVTKVVNSVEREPVIAQYLETLKYRLENLQDVDPRVDNPLKIQTEGMLAALDPRLIPSLRDKVDMNKPSAKVQRIVDNIADIYKRTTGFNVKKSGENSNLTQLLFLDVGIPKSGKDFSLYQDIKQRLIERGIKPSEIAFIQDANNDMEKIDLMRKTRNGDIRVLLGSTQKLGTGINVQDLGYAIHHGTIPYNPAALKQRLGRFARQGNELDEIQEHFYGTEQTLDINRLGILERKNRISDQIWDKDNKYSRETENFESTDLSYAEIQMALTNDERVKRFQELGIQVYKNKKKLSSMRGQTVRVQNQINDAKNELKNAESIQKLKRNTLSNNPNGINLDSYVYVYDEQNKRFSEVYPRHYKEEVYIRIPLQNNKEKVFRATNEDDLNQKVNQWFQQDETENIGYLQNRITQLNQEKTRLTQALDSRELNEMESLEKEYSRLHLEIKNETKQKEQILAQNSE